MITNIDIDIFKQPSDAMIHQANCFHCFGGGIALRVKANYPEAYAADCKTKMGDIRKLGTFSSAQGKKDGRWIYNMYSQFSMGLGDRHTNYEAFYEGLCVIKDNILALGLKTVAIPRNIGCTLGGGNWYICEKMIEVVFENSAIDVYICNYQPS
jgi:O-acetyl-ADP-ribose deacetylase (regulator of RNase III)